ncbi:hypothetical protein MPEAHAMD_5730 [Methylobacterium frigidaeris]|uniref:Inositolphosphotransferase Aur1/Ipt1 domain-containing protein n=2 Tax=Methylobacterium frigidaeris TaxID=2038277 RepID=A0AA37HI24_9HYPH|nr:hypothetical protein MPEAHAMD_5730 [Methylobacterium frigidaeris]
MRLQHVDQLRALASTAPHIRAVLSPLAAPHPALWAFVGAVAVIDAVWLRIAGIALAPLGFTLLAALTLALLLAAVFWSRATSHPTLRAMALSSACLISVTGSVGVLHYLSATLAFPLVDPMIVHVESVLGFDWRAHTAYLEGHPHLSRMLALSYHSSGPQIALVVIVLASTRRISRLWAFVRLFSVALACVVVLSAVLPAVGPYVFYAVDPSTPNGLETIGALWHLEPLINLRSSTMQVIALSEMRGLATFPSFHVSLALITAWALASVRYLGLVILSLNMAVIVATLSAGGHYLPDVLGGATIGLMLLMPRIAAWHIRTYTAFTRASANSRTDFIYIPRARFSLMTRRPERATSPHTRSSHGAGLARYSTGISEAKQIQS